ncbi:MAG: D-alanyl-D-alanine carboxypeptidase family protein [Nitrospiria bacterium]
MAFAPAFNAWADDAAWPKVRAKGVLLVELGQRQVLYESNAGKRLAPASLTKIMTALIAIEEGDPDGIVTVSRHAARAIGHRLRLRAGQTFRRHDLIDAMLVTSANDACRAVAESIGGSEAAFVGKMNHYADMLGLRDTHFENACGFDAPRHYSTARDLAHLATTAMEHPAFAESVAHLDGVLRTIDGRRAYRLRTTNRLMAAQYEGAVGVKTGFTRGAGRCLIARVVREEGDVLLVMLNAPRRWGDAPTLLTRAFETLAKAKAFGDPGMPGDSPSIVPTTGDISGVRGPIPL